MSHRRLLLIIVLTGLLSTALLSRSGVYAGNLNSVNPIEDDGTEVIGDWLRILKSPDLSYINRGDSVDFTIVVLNTSTKDDMVDVEVSDPLTPNCDRDLDAIKADQGKSYTCRHENVEVAFNNMAIVTGKNESPPQKEDSASDTAWVHVLELSATIEPESSTIPAPGPVSFTVKLTNLSSVYVKLDSLNSQQLGDLGDPQNGEVKNNNCTGVIGKQLSANGGFRECTFTTNISGPASTHPFNITATGKADNVADVTGSGATVVKITELITTSLAAEHEKYTNGSSIELTATIQNESETTAVNILTLEDATLGDVQPHGNCSLPKTLAPLDVYECDYEHTITEAAGEKQSFILNVSAETADIPPIALTDQASETVTVVDPLIYLPIMAKNPRSESCETALNINTNISYQFYPDTQNAYYRFVLTEPELVTVKITNFISSDGHLMLYETTGDECEIKRIKHDGGEEPDRELEAGLQQPGTYYVRVFNNGDLSTKEAYSLIVETD